MKKPDLYVIRDGAPLEEQFYYAFIHEDDKRASAILDRMEQTSVTLSLIATGGSHTTHIS